MQLNVTVPRYTNLPRPPANWKVGSGAKAISSTGESVMSLGGSRNSISDSERVEKAIKTLTTEQKQKLRDKYDIENIPVDSPQHKALLGELRDLGAISDEDYKATQFRCVHAVTENGKTITINGIPAEVWEAQQKTNDMREYHSTSEDVCMGVYASELGRSLTDSTGNSLIFASKMLDKARADGRIADVLKDIFG